MSGKAQKAATTISDELTKLYNSLPSVAGGKAVAFFKDNFQRQGWVYNATLRKWVPRKSKLDPGRGILMKSGRLRRSIRYSVIRSNAVAIGTDVPYAVAHNEGAHINKSVQVRSFVRRRFTRDETSAPGARKAKYTKTNNGTSNVKAHSRQMNTTIPQRQFIGESPDLILSAEREMWRKLENALRGIK